MTKLIYYFWLFYKFKLLSIVILQTNKTLRLVNSTFVIMKKKIIKITKLRTIKEACILPKILIKFYDIYI